MARKQGRNGGGLEEGGDTTGRYIVVLREEDTKASISSLRDELGISQIEVLEDVKESKSGPGGDNVFFPRLNAAVLDLDPNQFSVMGRSGSSRILAAEPERYVHALTAVPQSLLQQGMFEPMRGVSPLEMGTEPMLPPHLPVEPRREAAPPLPAGITPEYLRGYRDSVTALINDLLVRTERAVMPGAAELGVATWNEAEVTWGLQATGVIGSAFNGQGIKVAVLDTGFGPHQDFTGRNILARSFVPGQPPVDGHGHGTHCVGTACGPQRPTVMPRYGVAFGADILVGKVLNNQGSGTDGNILAGINWAISQGAHVISMSLGGVVQPNEPFSQVYEIVAQRALRQGTLIVAAAGNESDRPARTAAVARPANCPSIVAVGAMDTVYGVASFSCGGINPNGGEVNILAPGVDVYSSVPMPPFYRRLQGTSMATPHVAGIAALFAQATGLRGLLLWQALARRARPLSLPARDVGRGLVQAP
ncbi:peptidase S8 [Corallococcus sp. CA053C]|uniref:S8 family peptidase n=1 Tax=Corallococcus sp. CA053C TaxID=2316732 RepID=UPI000EA1E42E|nr:S8 family serine peptidase [Corallococcus sp. CA053C]RKH10767.1 peptidase S8 [Corallococcus sp. CA053C]